MSPDNYDYFEFTTEEELPEEQNPRMKQCPVCSRLIAADSLFCLYCGEAVSRPKKNIWVVITVCFILIAFVLWVFM